MQIPYKGSSRLVLFLGFFCCTSESDFPKLAEPTYPSTEQVVGELTGLSLADFYERSFLFLMQRWPESATDLGLSAAIGTGDNFLDNVSDDFLVGTYDLVDAISGLLTQYDKTILPAADRLTYDTYSWYLNDLSRERPYLHHLYSVNAGLTSAHQNLLSLFGQVHPLATRQNAEDYVERLWRVKRKMAQVIEGLEIRREKGLLPPRVVLLPVIGELDSIVDSEATSLSFYTVFAQGLKTVPGVSSNKRRELLEEAENAIGRSVQPAFEQLAAKVREILPTAPVGEGVWTLPGGEAYYAHLLRHHTTTELTADEIHSYGLSEVARIRAEMREIFDGLGYPTGESLAQTFARVARDGGQVPADQCIAKYTEAVRYAEQNLTGAIDLVPAASVEVRQDPIGGYYIPGAADGSRPGIFYAYVPSVGQPAYTIRTLAFHETVPGHHTQISIAREQQDLPTFRRAVTFTAQVEGWALYAEQLAGELGWYNNDAYGNLGRLQYELLRAVRLVVDTGLHAKQWSFDQAVSYMNENIGFPAEAMSYQGQVLRYLAWPAQATSYKMGMRELLAARARAQAAQGTAFSLSEFHSALLKAGSVPLELLDGVVAP